MKMEEASKIIGFTPGALWSAISVIIAAAILAKLGMDLMIKWRELMKPKVSDEKTIQDKLRSDNERLKTLEDTSKRQDKELRLILRSQMDILHHMIDGNGVEKMRKTQSAIEDYLVAGEIDEGKE